MIPVRDYDTYCRSLVTRIPDIDDYALVVSEDHLVKKLKDKTGIILAAVIPSADPSSPDPDNLKEYNICYIFVVDKPDHTNVTDNSELTSYENLQNAITDVKERMLADKVDTSMECTLMHRLDEDSLHTDPEYNIFGGYNGYSLSFRVESLGF